MCKQVDFEITGFAAVVDVLPIWRENSKKKFYQKKHTCVSLQGKQAVLMPWVSFKSSFFKESGACHGLRWIWLSGYLVIHPVWLKGFDGL